MITWTIDEDDFLEMLLDRLADWTNGTMSEEYELFEQYYTDMVESGAFSDFSGTIAEVVDNDWVNYFSVVEKSDVEDQFGKTLEELQDDGCIYAETDNYVLVYCG